MNPTTLKTQTTSQTTPSNWWFDASQLKLSCQYECTGALMEISVTLQGVPDLQEMQRTVGEINRRVFELGLPSVGVLPGTAEPAACYKRMDSPSTRFSVSGYSGRYNGHAIPKRFICPEGVFEYEGLSCGQKGGVHDSGLFFKRVQTAPVIQQEEESSWQRVTKWIAKRLFH